MAGQEARLQAGKLRLKRKRPPEQPAGEGEGAGLPRRLQTDPSSSGWFEAQGLSEADETWLALLKAADPQMNRSALGKVAEFPEFLNKSAQIANPRPEPETFTIGLEEFQWEPFPLYHREVGVIDCRIPQNAENPVAGIAEREMNEDEPSGTFSPVPDQRPPVARESTPKGSKPSRGIGHSSKDCGKKVKSSPRTLRQNSSKPSAPAATKQKLDLREFWKKASTQSQQKSTQESENETSSRKDTLAQNGTTSLLPLQGSPARSSVGGLQQNEDLDCCPMCQFRFAGTLSQLDRDGHLAKCLSESTEDVIW
ncbi:Fanconi anemia core complex-associated protein 20 [Paroedura picta]|uniref:Fanconi anemia core complex-associated protein 20 n=1 Tax=Paroedura picta TaxID=143630 RepID=UPI00405602C0